MSRCDPFSVAPRLMIKNEHYFYAHGLSFCPLFALLFALYNREGRIATRVMHRDLSVELLRNGDSEAWEDIVNQYQMSLSRYLYHMVKDRELAQELTQDTFLEAYKAMPETEGNLNLKSWLYRIATNNAIDVLRRRRLISWLPWVDEKTVSSRTTNDYEDRLAQREQVRGALAKLPDKYRAVLLLHDNQGFKCQEIGKMLNISHEAAKKRLTRAREMFRDAYQKLQKGSE
jgi:RNA polymerase sigma-70 factor (ECF subfamily)